MAYRTFAFYWLAVLLKTLFEVLRPTTGQVLVNGEMPSTAVSFEAEDFAAQAGWVLVNESHFIVRISRPHGTLLLWFTFQDTHVQHTGLLCCSEAFERCVGLGFLEKQGAEGVGGVDCSTEIESSGC